MHNLSELSSQGHTRHAETDFFLIPNVCLPVDVQRVALHDSTMAREAILRIQGVDESEAALCIREPPLVRKEVAHHGTPRADQTRHLPKGVPDAQQHPCGRRRPSERGPTRIGALPVRALTPAQRAQPPVTPEQLVPDDPEAGPALLRLPVQHQHLMGLVRVGHVDELQERRGPRAPMLHGLLRPRHVGDWADTDVVVPYDPDLHMGLEDDAQRNNLLDLLLRAVVLRPEDDFDDVAGPLDRVDWPFDERARPRPRVKVP
jgi:hypothetical protein